MVTRLLAVMRHGAPQKGLQTEPTLLTPHGLFLPFASLAFASSDLSLACTCMQVAISQTRKRQGNSCM
jgi:hypothetical protein